jgi:hypothetical protein
MKKIKNLLNYIIALTILLLPIFIIYVLLILMSINTMIGMPIVLLVLFAPCKFNWFMLFEFLTSKYSNDTFVIDRKNVIGQRIGSSLSYRWLNNKDKLKRFSNALKDLKFNGLNNMETYTFTTHQKIIKQIEKDKKLKILEKTETNSMTFSFILLLMGQKKEKEPLKFYKIRMTKL